MPQFDIKQEESKEAGRATFEKKEDYKIVTLNNDPQKKERLLHKIQADKLIAIKKATEVKGKKLDTREVETVVTEIKKD